MEQLEQDILNELKGQKGKVGFYFKNLITGQEVSYNAEEIFVSASVLKLPMFMCIEKWVAEGKVSLDEELKVRQEDKMPLSGALTLFRGEPTVDIGTMCNLMISISDNTATNMFMDRFGIDTFQEEFRNIGLVKTQIKRKFFDEEAAGKGLHNYICPLEMAKLLEQIYKREFVNREVSEEIERVLFTQQFKHKICGILGEEIPVAHKTGETSTITHDVGLVYATQPFIVCFAGEDVNVPEFTSVISRKSERLYKFCHE